MTVIYADLVFGLNLALDWTLLTMTAWMRGLSHSRWKVAAGAGLGTLYALVLFIPAFPLLYTYAGKILISIFMLLIAFGFRNPGYFFKNVAVFYFSAFVLAGGAIGIQYMLQDARLWSIAHRTSEWLSANDNRMQAGMGLVIAALPASYGLFRLVWKWSKRQQQVARQLVTVDIRIGDIHRQVTGLVDTGNHLNDPLSGAPVMVTEARIWEGWLPADWLQQLGASQSLDMLESVSGVIDVSKLRLLPYRGVNQGMQWMIGFKPDEIRITTGTDTLLCNRAIIGLDGGVLSRDGAFQAIVHPDMLETGQQKPSEPIPPADRAS
ncbi:sigma-E processing peptidase SpoIIGA [Paenibacillus dendritiformis]|uniref:sigma-E processing peptidase SpoIIGA n=1 Tax=Paenibacillus dendritiformis TaxID=130049 RepID=UPI00365B9D1E